MLGGEQDGGGWVALVLMNRMMVACFYAHPLQNMVVCTIYGHIIVLHVTFSPDPQSMHICYLLRLRLCGWLIRSTEIILAFMLGIFHKFCHPVLVLLRP